MEPARGLSRGFLRRLFVSDSLLPLSDRPRGDAVGRRVDAELDLIGWTFSVGLGSDENTSINDANYKHLAYYSLSKGFNAMLRSLVRHFAVYHTLLECRCGVPSIRPP